MRLAQPIWPRFLPSTLVLTMATLGPLGRRRRAPGTWGSVAGLLYFTVFFWPLGFRRWSALWMLALRLPGRGCAVALGGEADFRLGRRDRPEVIVDAMTAPPRVLLGWTTLA